MARTSCYTLHTRFFLTGTNQGPTRSTSLAGWFIVCINDGSSFSNSLNNEPIFQREKLDRENRMEAMENKKQAQCKNSIYDKLFGKCVRLSEHTAHFDRLKELCAYMPEVGHCSLWNFLRLSLLWCRALSSISASSPILMVSVLLRGTAVCILGLCAVLICQHGWLRADRVTANKGIKTQW